MYGFGGNYLCMIIILILIVLQWFRVGYGGAAGVGPENSLVACGGLFIITLFILVACCCCRPNIAPVATAAANRYYY